MGRLTAAGAIVLLAASSPLWAQDYRATILGQITDPQGAAMAAVKVVARNQGTGVGNEATTNERGLYRIPFLVPGEYSVTVEATGFRKAVRTGIVLNMNAEVDSSIQMEVGAATESVTVTADVPLLNTANAELGQVIDSRIVNVMNIGLTRNVTNLVQLAPGVTGGTGTYTSLAQNGFSITGGGSTRAGNAFLVDGMSSVVRLSD